MRIWQPPPNSFYNEMLIDPRSDESSFTLIGLVLSADIGRDSGFFSLEGQSLLVYILVMFSMQSFFVLSILVKLWLRNKPLGVGEMAQWVECILCKHKDLSLDSQHPNNSHAQWHMPISPY